MIIKFIAPPVLDRHQMCRLQLSDGTIVSVATYAHPTTSGYPHEVAIIEDDDVHVVQTGYLNEDGVNNLLRALPSRLSRKRNRDIYSNQDSGLDGNQDI